MIKRRVSKIKKLMMRVLMRLQESQLMMEKQRVKERTNQRRSIRKVRLSIKKRKVRPCSTRLRRNQLNLLKKSKIKKLLKVMSRMSNMEQRAMEMRSIMTKRKRV